MTYLAVVITYSQNCILKKLELAQKKKVFSRNRTTRSKIFEVSPNTSAGRNGIQYIENSGSQEGLCSARAEQIARICQTVKILRQSLHSGRSARCNKYTWVAQDWPSLWRRSNVSRDWVLWEELSHIVKTGLMECSLMSCCASHSDCHFTKMAALKIIVRS